LRTRRPRPTRRLQRRRSAAALTALGLVLVAAGCGFEDAQQEAAREEVQAHVRSLGPGAGYDAEDVHCTGAASTWYREVETDEFTCAVRRDEGGCDWFGVDVDRDRRDVRIRLVQRDAGCTLGF
jgi:hypothetical protein